MLGTGAADGWPNAFCDCASCVTLRGRGEVRAQTAALLDDVLLLDCGPDVPAAASRAGRSLAGVRHTSCSPTPTPTTSARQRCCGGPGPAAASR